MPDGTGPISSCRPAQGPFPFFEEPRSHPGAKITSMIGRRCSTVLLRIFLTCLICGVGYGLMQLPGMVLAYKQGSGNVAKAKRPAKKTVVVAEEPISPSGSIRLDESDKPADMESPTSSNCTEPEGGMEEAPVIKALKTVIDPELGVNIVDLGLIRNIDDLGNGNLTLTMVPTTPLCPYLKYLVAEIKKSVPDQTAYRAVSVKIDLQQRWTPDFLSEQGRQLFFGDRP